MVPTHTWYPYAVTNPTLSTLLYIHVLIFFTLIKTRLVFTYSTLLDDVVMFIVYIYVCVSQVISTRTYISIQNILCMDAAFLHNSLWDRVAVEPVCKREYLHCMNVCIRINSPTCLTSIKPWIVCTYTTLLHGVVMFIMYIQVRACPASVWIFLPASTL